MSDSESNDENFNDNSVDSNDNNNSNINSNKKKEDFKVNTNQKKVHSQIDQMSQVVNSNNKEDEEFKIENNENFVEQKNENEKENDSIIEIKTNNINNNKNINNQIKEKEKENEIPETKEKIKNFNCGNDISLLPISERKVAIILEIDEEKTKRNSHTFYQLIEIKNGSYSNKEQDISKKILCYRRYSEFDKFYNTLKFRYPHCIFPRLSEKKFYGNSERIFLENRRKELQYFINRLYYHEEISKSEEFKRFINSVFDSKYYENLPMKFYYPECEKANKEKGLFSIGMNKVKSYFTNTKEHKQSDEEKEILKRQKEFSEKNTKYRELLIDIKNIYDNVEETKKEYRNISNNLLYLKDDNNIENEKEEENYKNDFNELIDLNINFSELYDNNSKKYLIDIIDQLDYCILDVEGINRAIERFVSFIKEYEKVINTKSSNKYVIEEKNRIENDKGEFERFLLKDLKKYDQENEQIYEEIIRKLIYYIKKVNEDGIKFFKNININN